MFLSHDRPLDLQEHPVICTSVWPYFYAFHYKNHTAEYLCSENMFSSTFRDYTIIFFRVSPSEISAPQNGQF
jgi:hypothetical protein